jgi:hypothetical protein
MSDELWNSIKAKVIGQNIAGNNLPEACELCGKEMTPVDIGVDPLRNERTWVTQCCGKVQRYEEVLGEQDLI